MADLLLAILIAVLLILALLLLTAYALYRLGPMPEWTLAAGRG